MKSVHLTALVLTIIGALNWGLVGVFQWDLVAAIFGGSAAPLSRFIYTIVGVAGIVLSFTSADRAKGREVVPPYRRAA